MAVPRHHVIIGDGAVAAAFAEGGALVSGDRLTIVGPNVAHFGRGQAFSDHAADKPWRYAYLLGAPASQYGVGFAGWLAQGWPELGREISAYQPDWLEQWAPLIDGGSFEALVTPRAVFGGYLAERAALSLADLDARGVQVSLVAGLASDISRDAQGFRVTLSNGKLFHADGVDVATGGPAPQRFGADAGPTAFSTLYGNEAVIAEVVRGGQELTCLGDTVAALDVMRLSLAVAKRQDIRLRVIRLPEGGQADAFERDADYVALRARGQIVEVMGKVTWVYAEEAGRVRVRMTAHEGGQTEFVVPAVVNTAGAGAQLALDLVTTGLIRNGWLRLNETKTGLRVGAELQGEMAGLRYFSSAVSHIGG